MSTSSLHFYGVVYDSDTATVADAAVLVFACYPGGVEKLLGTTYSDREGAYLASIPQMPDEPELLGFKIRAGKACVPLEGVESPVYWEKQPDESQLPEEAQADDYREPAPAAETLLLDDLPTGFASPEDAPDENLRERETDVSKSREPDMDHDVTDRWEEAGLTVSLNQFDYNHLSVAAAPVVQTVSVTNIGTDSATLHGEISAAGGDHYDQRKFQIRAQGSEDWLDAGPETGSFRPEPFSFTISGLIAGVTYECKALAHNLAGWGEGNVLTFTAATLPEALVEFIDKMEGGLPGNMPQETLPPKNPYDLYRATYWQRLRQQKKE